MSEAHPSPDRDDPGGSDQSTPTGRRRARFLLPLLFLVLLAVVIVYMLLVSRRGPEDERDVLGGPADGAVVLQVVAPAGRLG